MTMRLIAISALDWLDATVMQHAAWDWLPERLGNALCRWWNDHVCYRIGTSSWWGPPSREERAIELLGIAAALLETLTRDDLTPTEAEALRDVLADIHALIDQ